MTFGTVHRIPPADSGDTQELLLKQREMLQVINLRIDSLAEATAEVYGLVGQLVGALSALEVKFDNALAAMANAPKSRS